MKQISSLLLYFSIFLLAGTGCLSSGDKQGKQKKMPVVNLEIPVSDNFLQVYINTFTYPVCYEEGGKDYMVAYNDKLHTLDVFNLTDGKEHRQIELQRDGPDQISSYPMGLEYYNGNYVMKTNTYCTIDSLGVVNRRVSIDRFMDSFPGYSLMKPNQILWFMFNFLLLDRESGTVAASFYPPEINDTPVKHPIQVGLLSLETQEVEKIAIDYPECFSRQTRWGVMNDLNATVHKDLLVYNFAGSSDVYTYNRNTKKTEKHAIQTKFTENLIVPNDEYGDENQTSIQAGYYFPVRYDSYRNVYWRLHIGKVNRQGGHFDRTYCLTRISPDFKTYKEIRLPNGLELNTTVLIGKSGLWMPYATGMAEEALWLYKIPLESFED